MPTRLIRLKNGILAEAEVPEAQAQPISSSTVKRVESTFDKVKPILVSVSKPIAEAWDEINQDMEVECAEVEVNFSFEGEGNLYVTKAKAGANLSVKLTLKPKK